MMPENVNIKGRRLKTTANKNKQQNKTNNNKNDTYKPMALHRKCEIDDIPVYNKQLYRIIPQIQKDFCPIGP